MNEWWLSPVVIFSVTSPCGVKWNFIIKELVKKHCMINNNKRRSRWTHFVHLRISIFCDRFYLLVFSNPIPQHPWFFIVLTMDLVHYLWTAYYIFTSWIVGGSFWESVKISWCLLITRISIKLIKPTIPHRILMPGFNHNWPGNITLHWNWQYKIV